VEPEVAFLCDACSPAEVPSRRTSVRRAVLQRLGELRVLGIHWDALFLADETVKIYLPHPKGKSRVIRRFIERRN
jgi:hypothetical protein